MTPFDTFVTISGRRIGPGEPPYFIADIGANHDGDLDRAFRLIELAKEAGADVAKFQNFVADRIVSARGFGELGGQIAHQSAWSKPVFEVYEDASLPPDWTPLLAERCRTVGIEYMTSPYDLATVDAVEPHVPAFKIGSGDVTWLDIVRHIGGKGKPVLIAAGASDQRDVDRAMTALAEAGAREVVLMQCNTNYTGDRANLRHVNLRVLETFAARHPGAVLGLSDHTPGHVTVCAALALGARVFEKHFTDDTSRTGPDHAFAMTPATWREMVDAALDTNAALGDGVKRVEPNERDAAVVQRRALRYARDLPAGHRLGPGDVFPTRPCPPDGLPPYRVADVLGRELRSGAAADGLVQLGDLA
jgi:N-acetylneuraminate synthase